MPEPTMPIPGTPDLETPRSPARYCPGRKPHDEQQKHGADGGNDDRRHNTAADVNAEPRQQPAADQRADDANRDIADQAEAAAIDDTPRKPASHETDQQDHQNSL